VCARPRVPVCLSLSCVVPCLTQVMIVTPALSTTHIHTPTPAENTQVATAVIASLNESNPYSSNGFFPQSPQKGRNCSSPKIQIPHRIERGEFKKFGVRFKNKIVTSSAGYLFFPCAIRFSRNPCPCGERREEREKRQIKRVESLGFSLFSPLCRVFFCFPLFGSLYIVVWVFGFPTQRWNYP
jgi:hypothetical protein